MGVAMSKGYSSHSHGSSSANPFLNIPCYTPHKLYLLALWIFEKRLKFSLKCDPMGVKFQSANPTTMIILCQLNFFWMFHGTVLTKVTWWDFEISNLLKKDWKFTLCPMVKWKIDKILGMASHRVKRSEICVSGVVVTGIWGTFDLLLFKVILEFCVKMACNSKMPGYTAKRIETWESGVVFICIWGTFNLLVFKVILGSFSALVSKWPVTRNGLK